MVKEHAANQKAIADNLAILKVAETYETASSIFETLKAAVGEMDRIRGGLDELGLSSVYAEDPEAPDLDALLASLDHLRAADAVHEAVDQAKKHMSASPPNYHSAIRLLREANRSSASAEQRKTIEGLLAEAKARKLIEDARRYLDQGEPNFKQAITALEEAARAAPKAPAASLLPRTIADLLRDAKARELEARTERARSEVQSLVERAEYQESQGKLNEALSSLEKAEATRESSGLPDTWDLAKRRQALEGVKVSFADYETLPKPSDSAPTADLQTALDARRKYLTDHPEGFKHEEVAAEVTALEERLSSVEGAAKQEAFATKLAEAQEAFAAGDLQKASEAAEVALTRAKEGGLETAEVEALVEKIKARARLTTKLEQNFVQVGAIYMSKYEVTRLEFWKFCRKLAKTLPPDKVPWPKHWKLADKGRSMPRPGVAPVGGVTYRAAEAYCAFMSQQEGVTYRLPTEAEWTQAATGGNEQSYPWGATWNPDKVIYGRQAPIAAKGTIAEALGGASSVGCLHMAGNVAEWVSDKWEDDEGIDDSARIVKGGSYRSFTQDLLRVSERIRLGITQHDPSVGFRVVVDPSGE
jgi:formylglycine-generating enzyme required for sulfatase activity